MASPFPGFDPYLEEPVLWSPFHHRFITYASDTINGMLPPGYVANPGERLYVVEQERTIIPDVSLASRRPVPRPHDSAANGVALAPDPPMVLHAETMEIRESFVEIRRIGKPGHVVTVLELLSPSNTAPGSHGRELYHSKQAELLQSTTILVEIDLLRGGRYTVAAPEVGLTQQGTWQYVVSLHRGGEGRRFEVWTFLLHQRLPRISVPLGAEQSDLVLPLQPILDHCYDAGKLDQEIDYSQDPPYPLLPTDAAWADALLREKGLRR